MFNRIKKLEKEIKRIEYEMQNSLWLRINPPRFKHGDQCSYCGGSGCMWTYGVTILCEKGVVYHQEYDRWWEPDREYYVSKGGLEDIGKSVYVINEKYLCPIK